MLLPEQLRLMAETYPDAVGYKVVDIGEMTFAQWEAHSNALARGLVAAGLEPGDRVGLHLPHELALRYLVAYPAIHRAGLVAVPMNPRLAPAEVTRMLGHCGARAVISGGQLVKNDAESSDDIVLVVDAGDEGGAGTIRMWSDVVDSDVSRFQVPLEDDDLADILYTSGTTGNPKGVAVRHTNASLLPVYVPAWSGHGWIHASPLYTFAGLASVYNPMKLGLTGVYMPRFEVKRWLEFVQTEKPTAVFLVPAMAQLLLAEEGIGDADLSSIELCSIGSAPLSPAVLQAMQDLMPDALVSNNYGMTEAGAAYCIMPKGEAVKRPGSVGMPARPAQVTIVDDDGQPLGPEEIGHVTMKVPGRPREYYLDPEASAQTWVGGWLNTGDLGKVDADGYLYIVGREKDVIIRGGNNIHAADVEHAIGAHPSVLEAAVIGAPHEVLGEDIVAFVVLRPGETADGEVLRAHCLALLSDYKVPRRWLFIDELPRNATGKVVKPELKTRLAAMDDSKE